MGAWGTGIYESDFASDIKNDYDEALKYSKDDDDALQIFIEEHKSQIEDSDDGPLTWLVLAQLMWKNGRLTSEILEKATQAATDDLKNWEHTSPKDYEKRQKNLEKFITALNEEQPMPKPIKRIQPFICDWKRGDVFLWKSNGTFSYKEQKDDEFIRIKGNHYLAIIFDKEIDYYGKKSVNFFFEVCR